MSNIKQAGHYQLREFTLLNKSLNVERDMLGLVGSFNILESVNNGAIRGSATIFESYDILNEFPIRGQEYIRITYSDFFDNERTEYYFVYAVDNISYGGEKNPSFMQYTLNFTSPYKFLSENFLVQRSYTLSTNNTQLIGDYANDLFDEYYRRPVQELFQNKLKRDLVYVPTTNNRKIVVPGYTPEEAMNFFARNAYTTTSYANKQSSQTYRFFEARDAFFFATNEGLLMNAVNTMQGLRPPSAGSRQILEFKRNYAGSISADSQFSAMSEILDINFGTRVNTIDTIVHGGYRRRIQDIDLLTMTVNEYDYNYDDEDNHEEDLNPIHDKLFIDQYMSKRKIYYIIRDWSVPGAVEGDSVRSDTHYKELYTSKAAHFYNHNMNTLNVSVYGRNNLFAGSYINITLYKHAYQKTTEEEERLNGTYLVESVNSMFDGNVFKQQLKLTRGGIKL
jgi:hypothetical protein